MILLDNYEVLTKIYESINTLVYRAFDKENNQLVILKCLKDEYPSTKILIKYKQEYEITKNLEVNGIIKAYKLKEYQNSLIIVFEDFGANSLKISFENKKLSIKQFLKIAIKITSALRNIHSRKIIHKDINSSNIVYNSDTQQLKIIDFGISSVLEKEKQTLKNPNVLEGTLAYISPEQTGRINRFIDYRSDFYSLGVTFYELLTNQLPFNTDDLLELIHCHVTKNPVPVYKVNREVPKIISDIIMKLMSKNPEERYQSALSLKKDLTICLKNLQNTGSISDFKLASQDIYDRFQISQKIYGREKEIKFLLNTFDKVIDNQNKNSAAIFISGYSGIGKSVLVREIYRPITKANGYFISGKFDQYQKDIPYSAIVQALGDLIEYILVESEAALKQWREKLLEALGVNAGAIIQVIPKLKLITGEVPEVASLPPKAAENRFNFVFQRFIKVFARSEHPLVIFLDDLQWADRASLDLMKSILTELEENYLLLIATYRDNEVSSLHPLISTIEEIERAGVTIEKILLFPLRKSEINTLIRDSFSCSFEDAEKLGELISTKTDGNPFFINQFLRSLYAENLLNFNYQKQIWEWDIEVIKKQNITENVVELLSRSIKKLNPEIQKILQLAACIGDRFEIETLAIISQNTLQQTALLLKVAIAANFIYALGDTYKAIELEIKLDLDKIKIEYKFSHDRIQQAAYSLISNQQREVFHLLIGQLLLKNTSEQDQENKIFSIVNQLNLGRKLIKNEEEKEKLTKLNLIGAKKAKQTAAYRIASDYLKIGLELFKNNINFNEQNLKVNLHLENIEIAYLIGNFDEINKSYEYILKTAKKDEDRAKAYKFKMKAYTTQNKLIEAVDLGYLALKQFNISIPIASNNIIIFIFYIKTLIRLTFIIFCFDFKKIRKKNIKLKLNLLLNLFKSEKKINSKFIFYKRLENLINLPSLKDSKILQGISILESLSNSAFLFQPRLRILIELKEFDLFLKYGNYIESPICLVQYAAILCGLFNNINLGYEIGKIAIKILDRSNDKTIKVKTLLRFGIFILHWKEDLKSCTSLFLEVYNLSIEVGDFEYSGYSAINYIYNLIILGYSLDAIKEKINCFLKTLSNLKQFNSLHQSQIIYQFLLNLINYNSKPWILTGDIYNETTMKMIYFKNRDNFSIIVLFNFKLWLAFLFENYSRGSRYIRILEQHLIIYTGVAGVCLFVFYACLNKIYFFKKSKNQKTEKKLNQKFYTYKNRLKQWSKLAPMNYQHKYDLVEAEFHSIQGNREKAATLYESSIKGAKKYKYIHEEALAWELAAKFYLEWNKFTIAKTYMREAHYKYQLWGATAKANHLEKKYPELISENNKNKLNSNNIKTTLKKNTFSSKLENLDFNILAKTNRIISKEQDLDILLAFILKFSLQAVGAQEGLIILNESGRDLIKSEAKIEGTEIIIQSSDRISKTQEFPQSVVNYVKNTRETVVEGNASLEGKFLHDDYVVKNKAQSILCLPLISQGRFVAVIYLENNLASNVFKEEDLGVLELITTQAAISIENTMLKKRKSYVSDYYQLGTSLDPKAPSYVERDADKELYENLRRGHYCYILNARQMGKSSLRVRVADRLESEGYKCALIDIQSLGSEDISRSEWYEEFLAGLIYNNFSELVTDEIEDWLDNISSSLAIREFKYFFEKIILPQVKSNIIIFIEEIDSVRNLPFSVNDFFGMLRYFYNSRSHSPEFKRISFVFIGAALPVNLVNDPQITPFNVGKSIRLSGLKLENTWPLIDGFKEKCENPQVVMQEILEWTGGQPFLTQLVCSSVKLADDNVTTNNEKEWITNLVETKIINNWQQQDETGHLSTIQKYVLKNKISPKILLTIYQNVLLDKEVIFSAGSREQLELLIIGIIKVENNRLKLFNKIYQSIFNLDWVEQNLKTFE